MTSRSRTPVRIGIVGAGFVADLYLRALQHVRFQEVTALAARSPEKAREVAKRFDIPTVVDNARTLAERDDVDLVVIALPQDLHVQAVADVVAAGKAVICTKPLGRNAAEAAECLRLVTEVGVWHAYAETEVFAPALVSAKELTDSGAIGEVLTVRSREAHGHPHEHAKDAARSGGGPLRTLGCHCVAIGRWFIGYEHAPVEVLAWGDRLARQDVSTEDTATAIVRFANQRVAQIEVGWNHVAGLDVRNEIHGTRGWIATDETGSTGIHAYAGSSAGYVMEKAGNATGWITPVPDEAWTYGYHAEMAHFIECFRHGATPRQTFVDGYIDNAVIDAVYQAIERGTWAPIDLSAISQIPPRQEQERIKEQKA
ncbi:MAG: gfo/Idh/MocA family oxidoreductase [Microbacteriaceae bacterium]|nr:MAG: gfo/Idh/MocA family oxidoreductase [Microbacteriaceae bacterium]